jgi:hypothetical protein
LDFRRRLRAGDRFSAGGLGRGGLFRGRGEQLLANLLAALTQGQFVFPDAMESRFVSINS